MREFAKGFYTSKAWRQTSKAYMQSRYYVCERCGGVGEICHHKRYLNANNITDPAITLGFDNLECLCRDCHGKEHELKKSLVYFDDAGEIDRVKDSRAIKDFKQTTEQIDSLLKELMLEQGVIKNL